ncbi:MAG: recombinase A [Planctomycetaceae bacterium]|jgi:recombination protein RecA|nr:recombinase A [Planctomycetaceae bacterium]|tara:strand:+ start:5263 stop:5889 length:627 start_codon:yes stop_codon:yes gene_type:complete
MIPAAVNKIPGITRASALTRKSLSRVWSWEALAGQVSEISGAASPATLTLSMDLVLDAQRQSEVVAWITTKDRFFFPPDVVECGIDLGAMVVVRAPTAADAPRAAEMLIRSGAFGLVVLDMGKETGIPLPMQARLVKLAQQHHTAVLYVTIKPDSAASVGSLVSLHATTQMSQTPSGSYECGIKILKDKHSAPNWAHREVYCGPAGLR